MKIVLRIFTSGAFVVLIILLWKTQTWDISGIANEDKEKFISPYFEGLEKWMSSEFEIVISENLEEWSIEWTQYEVGGILRIVGTDMDGDKARFDFRFKIVPRVQHKDIGNR